MNGLANCLQRMAQVFPLNVDANTAGEQEELLADTLAGLPDAWTLLRNRRIRDEAETVDVVLVHPEIGIALVDMEPRNPEPSVAGLRAYLEGERLGEFFPGELPIVALRIKPEDVASIGERLAAAFDAAPQLSITDLDWAEAVIELLLTPNDLSMAPVGEPTAQTQHDLAASSHGEPAPENSEGSEGSFARFTENRAGRTPPREREEEERAQNLAVDWPFAPSYVTRRRRRRLLVATAVVAVLSAIGIGAWTVASEDEILPRQTASSPPTQVEMTLPPQQTLWDMPKSAARPQTPPPVPPAPPVMLAARPLVPPPPAPIIPSPIEPLPQVTASTAPPAAAPAPAPASPPPPPTSDKPQTETASSAPPAAASSAPPPSLPSSSAKPLRTAKTEPPPISRAPPSRREARAPSRGPQSQSKVLRPPIDATELPPLDELPATSKPPRDQVKSAPEPAPPPPREAAARDALAAPTPLGPQTTPSPLPPESATTPPPPAAGNTNARDCRPYTANTTLTGRDVAVQGIACRGTDGQWRLVSEIPVH